MAPQEKHREAEQAVSELTAVPFKVPEAAGPVAGPTPSDVVREKTREAEREIGLTLHLSEQLQGREKENQVRLTGSTDAAVGPTIGAGLDLELKLDPKLKEPITPPSAVLQDTTAKTDEQVGETVEHSEQLQHVPTKEEVGKPLVQLEQRAIALRRQNLGPEWNQRTEELHKAVAVVRKEAEKGTDVSKQAEQITKALEEFERIAEKTREVATKATLQELGDETRELRNQGTGKEWRKATGELHRDIEAARERFKAGEKVSEKELQALAKRFEYLKQATTALSVVKGAKATEETSNIYARGLDALAQGKTAEAELQGMLGKQYAANREQRPQIGEWSRKTAAGKQEAVAKELGAYFSKKLDGAGIKDEQMQGSLATISRAALTEPTIENLKRAEEAVNVAKEFKKADGLVKRHSKEEREGLAEINRRILSGMAGGASGNYVREQRKLADMYTYARRYTLPTSRKHVDETRRAKRDEINRVSARLESEGIEKMRGDLQAYTSISGFLHASTKQQKMEGRRNNAAAEDMYRSLNGPLTDVLGKIADGTPLTEQDKHTLMLGGFLSAESGGLGAMFATSQQDAGWYGSMFEGVPSAQKTLAGLKGFDREAVAGFYRDAAQSYEEGNHDAACAHVLAAQAYAAAKTDADKDRILELSEQIKDGKVKTDVIQWELRTKLERVGLESKIEDPEQRSNTKDYYDMSLIAYQRGDTEGAKILRNLGDMYGRAAAINDGSPAVAEALGLVGGMEGLLPLEQLKENYLGEKPKTFGELHGLSPEERPKEFHALTIRLGAADARLNATEFKKRKVELGGRRERTSYEREGLRLQKKAGRTADEIEKGRLADESAIVDVKRNQERHDEAVANYDLAVQLYEEAANKRLEALDTADEAERNRLLAESDQLLYRSTVLMQAAEGQQQALLGIDNSVRNIDSINRESGRSSFNRGYERFGEIATAVKETEKPDIEFATTQNTRAEAGTRDIAGGSFKVEQQMAIAKTTKRITRLNRKRAAKNKENAERYEGITVPTQEIGKKKREMVEARRSQREKEQKLAAEKNAIEDMEKHGQDTAARREAMGKLVVSKSRDRRKADKLEKEIKQLEEQAETAYDAESVQSEIDRSTRLARREKFAAATRAGRRASSGMNYGAERARLSSQHWISWQSATAEEQKGQMDEFRTFENLEALDRAKSLADEGKINEANKEIARIGGTVTIQYERQHTHNIGNRHLARAEAAIADKKRNKKPVTERMSLKEAAEKGIKLSPGTEQRDAASERRGENEDGVRATGIDKNLDKDADAVAARERELAGKAFKTRDSIQSVEDARKAQELRSRLVLEEATIGYDIAENPAEFDRNVRILARTYGYSEVAAAAVLHDIVDRGSQLSYEDHAIGWNLTRIAADKAVDTLSEADQLRLARAGTSGDRRVLRSGPAKRLVQLAVAASRDPALAARRLKRGEKLYFTGLKDKEGRTSHAFRTGSDIADNYRIDLTPADLDIVDVLYDSGKRRASRLERIAEKGQPGALRDAHKIAAAELKLELLSLGIDIYRTDDTKEWKAREISLSREEHEAVADALGTIKQTRENLFIAATRLGKSMFSRDDAVEAIDELRGIADTVGASTDRMVAIADERNGAIERVWKDDSLSPEQKRLKVASLEDKYRDEIYGESANITSAEEKGMVAYNSHIDEGESDAKVANYSVIGVKMLAGGLVTALVPGGGAFVAGFFFSDALHSFNEQREMAGGTEYWTGRDWALNAGAIGIAGLGVGLSWGQAVLQGLGNEAIMAGRVIGMGEQVAGMSRLSRLGTAVQGASSGALRQMPRALQVGGISLMGGGFVLGGVELYDLIEQRKAGANITGFDIAFSLINTVMPGVEMGARHAIHLSPSLATSRRFGARVYRGFMMGLGVSREEIQAPALLVRQQRHTDAMNGATPQVRESIGNIEMGLGRQLDVNEISILRGKYKGGEMDINESIAILTDYDTYVNGGTRVDEQGRTVRVKGVIDEAYGGRITELDIMSMERMAPEVTSEQAIAAANHFGDDLATVPRSEIHKFLEERPITGSTKGKYKTLDEFATEYGRAEAGRPLTMKERAARAKARKAEAAKPEAAEAAPAEAPESAAAPAAEDRGLESPEQVRRVAEETGRLQDEYKRYTETPAEDRDSAGVSPEMSEKFERIRKQSESAEDVQNNLAELAAESVAEAPYAKAPEVEANEIIADTIKFVPDKAEAADVLMKRAAERRKEAAALRETAEGDKLEARVHKTEAPLELAEKREARAAHLEETANVLEAEAKRMGIKPVRAAEAGEFLEKVPPPVVPKAKAGEEAVKVAVGAEEIAPRARVAKEEARVARIAEEPRTNLEAWRALENPEVLDRVGKGVEDAVDRSIAGDPEKAAKGVLENSKNNLGSRQLLDEASRLEAFALKLSGEGKKAEAAANAKAARRLRQEADLVKNHEDLGFRAGGDGTFVYKDRIFISADEVETAAALIRQGKPIGEVGKVRTVSLKDYQPSAEDKRLVVAIDRNAYEKAKKTLDVKTRSTPEEYGNAMRRALGVGEDAVIRVEDSPYETVLVNNRMIKKALADERNLIAYKDELELYASLAEGSARGLANALHADGYAFDVIDGQYVGIVSMDKGKTWLLNKLRAEFGDAGLLVYFRAIRELRTEFAESIGRANIPTVKLTKTGDEVVIVVPERFGIEYAAKHGGPTTIPEAIEFTIRAYNDKLASKVNEVAGRFGFETPKLSEAMTDFSVDMGVAKLRLETREPPHRIVFVDETPRRGVPVEYRDLGTMLNGIEVRARIDKVTKPDASGKAILTEEQGNILKGVARTKGPKIRPRRAAPEGESDFAVEMRGVKFTDENGKKAYEEFARASGKGVASVEEEMVGPSIGNLFGHDAGDVLKNGTVAIQEALERHGLSDRVEAVPNGAARTEFYITSGDKEATIQYIREKIIPEAEAEATRIFSEMKIRVEEAGFEAPFPIKEVRMYAGEDAKLQIEAEMMYGRVEGRPEYNAEMDVIAGQISAVMHLSPEEMMPGVGSPEKWARDPSAVAHHYRQKGVEVYPEIIKRLAAEEIVAEPGAAAPRRKAGEAEAMRKAAGAEEAALAREEVPTKRVELAEEAPEKIFEQAPTKRYEEVPTKRTEVVEEIPAKARKAVEEAEVISLDEVREARAAAEEIEVIEVKGVTPPAEKPLAMVPGEISRTSRRTVRSNKITDLTTGEEYIYLRKGRLKGRETVTIDNEIYAIVTESPAEGGMKVIVERDSVRMPQALKEGGIKPPPIPTAKPPPVPKAKAKPPPVRDAMLGGRGLANKLVADADAMLRYATELRFGIDTADVKPETKLALKTMPKEFQKVVLEFAEQIKSRDGWRVRNKLVKGHQEKLGRLVNNDAVRSAYDGARKGRIPADPADAIAVDHMLAADKALKEGLPITKQQAEMVVETAGAIRGMSKRLIEKTGSDAVLQEARDYAKTVRETKPKPGEPTEYTLVRELAEASAMERGVIEPTAEDYLYGALALKTMETQGLSDTATIKYAVLSSPEESSGLAQHVRLNVEWGGMTVEVLVFKDKIVVPGASAEMIGRQGWRSPKAETAFTRYAQIKLGNALEGNVRKVMRAIPKKRVEKAPAKLDASLKALRGMEVDTSVPLRAKKPGKLKAEDVLSTYEKVNIAEKREAAEAFVRMPAKEQDKALALLEAKAKPLEEQARMLEVEARVIERKNNEQHLALQEEVKAIEAKWAKAEDVVSAIRKERNTVYADHNAAEQRGDTPTVKKLKARIAEVEERLADAEKVAGRLNMEKSKAEMAAAQVMEKASYNRSKAERLRDQAEYWQETAVHYRELKAVSGETGAHLSKMYGIPKEVLEGIYSTAPSAKEARKTLYRALGIELGKLPGIRSDAYQKFLGLTDDTYLSSMILTGDALRRAEQLVLPEITGLAPGEKVAVTSIEFQNGLVGAYRLKLEVIDGTGKPRPFTDIDGKQRDSMLIFAKRQDLSPDQVGTRGSIETGAPAPEVITKGLSYIMPDGREIGYGMMRDIRDFRGKISMGGEEAFSVSVDSAESLHSMSIKSKNPKTQEQRNELFAEMENNPLNVLEALGYAQTGFAAGGFYDRHEGNIWPMWLRIKEPKAKATGIAQRLEGKGFRVRQNNDGSYSVFRFGGIDSDTFASYSALVNDDGSVSLKPMEQQFTSDLHREFVRITHQMNDAEMRMALADDRAPQLMTVDEIVSIAFGADMDGPFANGMKMWLRDFAPNTDVGAAFVNNVRAHMDSYHGQRSGMGTPLEGTMLGSLESHGYIATDSPINGATRVVNDADGRSIFWSSAKTTLSPAIAETAGKRFAAAFPEGITHNLIRLEQVIKAERSQLVSQMKDAKAVVRTIGGKKYIDVPNIASIPAEYLEHVVLVRRDGDTLHTTDYAGLARSLPNGKESHIIRVDRLKRSDAREILRAKGGREMELGVTGKAKYVIFDSPESIPKAHRGRAVRVLKTGIQITADSTMPQRLGIDGKEIGSKKVFDHMMTMGDEGWTSMWEGVRNGILAEETRQKAELPADQFLAHRVPLNPKDPKGQAMLPTDYKGSF